MNKDHQNMAGKISPHAPVLAQEVLKLLKPKPGESYLDLTAGYGGHAKSIIDLTGRPELAVLVDRDTQAIDFLKRRFAGTGARLILSDFNTASTKLLEKKQNFKLILADLGASSLHFDQADRGFSLAKAGPLDMRMDNQQALSAEEIVNSWPQLKLENILRHYGEEPRARKISKAIVAARPLHTTLQLAELVKRTTNQRSKIHPATKTFQALRITVNGELDQLENSLPKWNELLADGGRLAIISFHSLEDRLVKTYFAEHSRAGYEANLRLLTKKPVRATSNELIFNPRARSAKLRAAVKIKTKIER